MHGNGKQLAELLKTTARIDERTRNTQRDVTKITSSVDTLFKKVNKVNETIVTMGILQKGNMEDIKEIQDEHKKRFHTGTVLGVIKWVLRI